MKISKQKEKTGILLVNLGTPKHPTTYSIRKYLKEFLMDKRVISIPYILRFFLVYGIIAPFRSSRSALAYRKIWYGDATNGISPLMKHSYEQEYLLSKKVNDEYIVKFAMRYQNPSIGSVMREWESMKLKKIILIPMYPQYATATTGSTIVEFMKQLSKWKHIPNTTIISSFYNNEIFIKAWANILERANYQLYDHIVMSYHGLPKKQLEGIQECYKQPKCCNNTESQNKNCYSYQCFKTSKLIAKKINLPEDKYSTTFQSRLGNGKWTEPYTSDTLISLAKQGKKTILVCAPSFVSDCLETLYELGIEEKEKLRSLGVEIHVTNSLNGDPKWIESLENIIKDPNIY